MIAPAAAADVHLARVAYGDAALAEATIQTVVMQHLSLRARPGVVAFHVPSGGKRSRAEAGRFKAQGVVAGVPDVLIFANGSADGLELKTVKGRLSDEQHEMHRRLSAAGVIVATAYGLNEALRHLHDWELLKP